MGFGELVVGAFKFLLIIIGVLSVTVVVLAARPRDRLDRGDRDRKRLSDQPPSEPPKPPEERQ